MDETLDAQLRVFLRDLISGELVAYPAEEWLPAYADGVNEAIELWQASLGGTIAITGTPEQGRVTVNDADHIIILDSQWWTVAVDAAGNPLPAGDTL
ncbi:hypothetical protein AXK57_00110 [Tsukamurella pulmonis]|uniref:hypothetical protein n=1 Tax=Tsukamurella pulmonis TaxID=47312 RepID=UPI000794C4ED|nr:hypothetical protein [Tsukamurella pulmonis]KXP12700.1 hypothetical protein AXK57_00110 [Tsukamurella pulmonis]